MQNQRHRSTPGLLKDLRTLKVAVFHQRDHDGEQLIRQLQRIGCQVQAFWPPQVELSDAFEVIFLAVNPDTIGLDLPWTVAESGPTLIAVVNYENPTIVDAVLRFGARAVVASPIRSFGVLSSLILARRLAGEIHHQNKRIAKLESKLQSTRKISEAKTILMSTRSITEQQAYSIIREQAMAKRATIEEIATAIINANEILALTGKGA